MRTLVFIVAVSGLLLSCSQAQKREIVQLKEGAWHGTLQLNDTTELPFNFYIDHSDDFYTIEVQNAEERIRASEVKLSSDSVFFKLPVFDSEFKLAVKEGRLEGLWYNYAKAAGYSIPFRAVHGFEERFPGAEKHAYSIGSRWAVEFSPGTEEAYPAIGEFRQEGGHVTGTFLTETGDYRFLEGVVSGNQLLLSAFDGAHAFLFKGRITSSASMKGIFYSGTHWAEPWVARRAEHAQISHPDSLTWLKEGYDKLAFTFPDLQGQPVSLEDAKFQDKVVIVQILGSWCPNCMDETAYLTEIYEDYHRQGLEIIGLCYERTTAPARAKKNIERLVRHFKAPYDFLIAGTSRKTDAASTLPMLNHIMSFPTTIYIDKKGAVRKIHTGFSGPGTSVYVGFVRENKAFLEQLLNE